MEFGYEYVVRKVRHASCHSSGLVCLRHVFQSDQQHLKSTQFLCLQKHQ